MDNNSEMKAGVLIIGSLLWQDHLQDQDSDEIRKNWRDKFLNVGEKIMVRVPIRYGRLSSSGIYTMTFSKSVKANRNGTGFFIPFKKTSLASFDDLINEAKEMSTAEGMNGNLSSKERGTENIWCSMGLLINSLTVQKPDERSLINSWSKKLNERGQLEHKQFKLGNESSCIDKNGKLSIGWPSAVDKREEKRLSSYDLIIATATKPTKYPNVKELSENVSKDSKRYYFIENFKSGITTFQDVQILNKI